MQERTCLSVWFVQMRQQQADEQMKEDAENVKKDREEAKKARERVKAQIAQDR